LCNTIEKRIKQIAGQHNSLLNKFTSVEATCFGSIIRMMARRYEPTHVASTDVNLFNKQLCWAAFWFILLFYNSEHDVMRDLTLQLSSEILNSVQWYFITDVSEQPTSLIQFLEPGRWDRLFSETSVLNCHSTPCNIPEERKSHCHVRSHNNCGYVYSLRYDPWFHVTAVGLGTYYLGIRCHISTLLKLRSL
jgi:hypothetical protein